jgi:HD-GYP domain-containing protein (c-di-GMP phosphodiesterase class II)
VRDALDEIRAGAGTHFDPRLVDLFLALDRDVRDPAKGLLVTP